MKKRICILFTIFSTFLTVSCEDAPVSSTKSCESEIIATVDTIEYEFGNCIVNYKNNNCTKLIIPDQSPHGIKINAIECIDCPNVTEIVLPNSIEIIQASAFEKCPKLKIINWPNELKNIDNSAFRYCTQLESIKLPQNLTEISNYAFKGCSNIKEITFNDSLTKIGYECFSKCRSLQSVRIKKTISNVDDGTFSFCSSLSEIIIEDGIKSLGSQCFQGCNIKKIFIPKTIEKINDNVFSDCPKDLTIYCEAEKQPSGYSTYWNSDNHKIIWNSKRSDVE